MAKLAEGPLVTSCVAYSVQSHAKQCFTDISATEVAQSKISLFTEKAVMYASTHYCSDRVNSKHDMYCIDFAVTVLLMLQFESSTVNDCNSLSVYGAMIER